jgi:hypothetical protein
MLKQVPNLKITMDLSQYKFPEVTQADVAFPTFDAPKDLIEEGNKRDLKKGRAKFNELFYKGGSVELQPDVEGTWKEKAWIFTRVLMGSWAPKHQDKETVCALLMEECLVL